MLTATLIPRHVAYLRAMVDEPRRHLLHLRQRTRGRRGIGGFIMKSLNRELPEAVTYKLAVEKRQQEVYELSDKSSYMKGEPETIDSVRAALKSMSNGEITISAYDTAWVALVKKIDGAGDGPQFPSCIDWIARNQLPDGSWGDHAFFSVHDRIINTLACIIALKSWNVHHDRCSKGLSFIHENMCRLPEDDENWMLAGFETILPTLLEMANDLGLDMPHDEPALLQLIQAKRDLKLAKIPKDVLHTVPTALLLSMEGMQGLNWERLFKLQSPDGSFMSSVAPTAYALMQTGDKKCFEFLNNIVGKFNGGAPFVYPVEMYERLWLVDRLERLGISSYFRSEIDGCLDYAYRHWSEEGLGFTTDCAVRDIDDTAMGFRLLRLHGYHVSPCVFERFEDDDGEFVVYPGQSSQSVSAMYNLYRAADHAAFPGDDGVLRRARSYSRSFLQARRASGQLSDKWLITQGLPGEVAYGLDFPWKTSLPRVETRMYLDQYGGSADVWIGKVLYRMPLISNDLYLKMAKADFVSFQRSCRHELHGLERWCSKNNLETYGVTPNMALRAYFLAAANIFEADRAAERMGWARTAVLAEAFTSQLRISSTSDITRIMGAKDWTAENGLLSALDLIGHHAPDDKASDSLRETWKQWLTGTAKEKDDSYAGNTALLLVRTVEICSGRLGLTHKTLNLPEYSQLEQLTYSICSKLGPGLLSQNNGATTENVGNLEGPVDQLMQELTQRVSGTCNAINRVTKQTFLHVARSYCYVTHCSPETIDSHISMVLFEEVA